MDLFNNDPFDDIMKEFFGERARRSNRRDSFAGSEEEDRVIDFIEDGNSAYLVFEIPGYAESDVNVEVDGKSIEITAKRKDPDGMKEYLSQKLARGIHYKSNIPKFINSKKFKYSVKNGILEIVFLER